MLTPDELAEANNETLECARYGEADDLKELLTMGADPNYRDENGTTAMHKAAANGEVGCLIVLKEAGALHQANIQGNLPLHWAAQNGKLDAVKYLIESYDNIDVLIQNTFGRSVLTEAFQSQNPDVIEVCLSHSSASEEKLMPDSVRNASATASNTTNSNNTKVGGSVNISDHMEEDAGVDTNEDSMDVDESDTVHNPASDNAVYHYMSFLPKRKVNPTLADTLDQSLSISDTKPNPNLTPSPNPSANSITTTVPCMRLRELPITRADNPFGSDTSPELDTTGLGIWPASVLAAKWVMHNRKLLAGKTVVELGAGCGLPGLAAAMYCGPKSVHITDIHTPTLQNAVYNAHLNATNTTAGDIKNVDYEADVSVKCVIPVGGVVPVSVKKVDWGDGTTFPLGGAGAVDVIIGSDLVYEDRILRLLVPAVYNMLPIGGHFLYVAPIEGRQGMDALESALTAFGFTCVTNIPAPPEFYINPLVARSVIGNMTTAITGNSDFNPSSMDAMDDEEGLLIDDYILHFYDLSIQKPHFCYHFIKVK